MTDSSLKQIKKLWMKFDPIGVYGHGSEWPDDEYDSYIMPTYELLKKNASDERLKAYVIHVVNEQMELEIDQKLIDIFSLRSFILYPLQFD